MPFNGFKIKTVLTIYFFQCGRYFKATVCLRKIKKSDACNIRIITSGTKIVLKAYNEMSKKKCSRGML